MAIPEGWELFPLKMDEDWWRRLWMMGAGTVVAPVAIVKV